MDTNGICSVSPIRDAAGSLYIPTHVLPYDGGMLRYRADRIAPSGRRETGYLLEEYVPRLLLPYLERQPDTGLLSFRGGGNALAAEYEAAQARFWARLLAAPRINASCGTPDPPFICPFHQVREGESTLIVVTGGAATLREYVKSRRPDVPDAAYVRQCLTIILALTERLKTLEGRWLVSALTPDSVLISHVSDENDIRVQLSDAAYLFPFSQASLHRFPSPLSWRTADFPSDDFTDRWAAEARGPSMNGKPGLLPCENVGLYSVSQLLCYLLFVKPWNLNAETLSIRFPAAGVLRRQALRESLEEAVALGLRLRPAAQGRMEACEEFEQLLKAPMEELRKEDDTVFLS